MAIKHVNRGLFIDTDPIEPPEDASGPAEGQHIYAYAIFRSLEHVSYGLTLKDSPLGDKIDSVEVGQYGMDPLNPYWEFNNAIDEIGGANHAKRGSDTHIFEEVPYVEVETEEQYNEALDALELEEDEGDIFDGPGLYDFRDSPPTYQGTVEENELNEMIRAADEAFDFMFQGEEWKDAYSELAGDEEDEDEDVEGDE